MRNSKWGDFVTRMVAFIATMLIGVGLEELSDIGDREQHAHWFSDYKNNYTQYVQDVYEDDEAFADDKDFTAAESTSGESDINDQEDLLEMTTEENRLESYTPGVVESWTSSENDNIYTCWVYSNEILNLRITFPDSWEYETGQNEDLAESQTKDHEYTELLAQTEYPSYGNRNWQSIKVSVREKPEVSFAQVKKKMADEAWLKSFRRECESDGFTNVSAKVTQAHFAGHKFIILSADSRMPEGDKKWDEYCVTKEGQYLVAVSLSCIGPENKLPDMRNRISAADYVPGDIETDSYNSVFMGIRVQCTDKWTLTKGKDDSPQEIRMSGYTDLKAVSPTGGEIVVWITDCGEIVTEENIAGAANISLGRIKEQYKDNLWKDESYYDVTSAILNGKNCWKVSYEGPFMEMLDVNIETYLIVQGTYIAGITIEGDPDNFSGLTERISFY